MLYITSRSKWLGFLTLIPPSESWHPEECVSPSDATNTPSTGKTYGKSERTQNSLEQTLILGRWRRADSKSFLQPEASGSILSVSKNRQLYQDDGQNPLLGYPVQPDSTGVTDYTHGNCDAGRFSFDTGRASTFGPNPTAVEPRSFLD